MTDEQAPKQPRESEDHDGNYKLMFSDPVLVREFLEDFGPSELVETLDFSTLELMPAEFVDERTRKQRRSDLVWRVRKKDGSPCYVAIILEFQSRRNPYMALKVLVYSGLFLQTLVRTGQVGAEGFPPLLPIMIYNGPDDWDEAEEVADLFAPMDRILVPFNPRQRYLPVKIMALPEDALKGRGIAAQVFRMEQARDPKQLKELVKETIGRFDAEKYENARRIIAGWLGDVLSVRFKVPAEQIKRINTLQGVHSMLAHNLELWKAECMQVGEARGEARGEVRMARRLAKDALLDRFGGAPDEVMARLEAISDPESLRRLAGDAWKVKSLEDFAALLESGASH